LEIDVASYDHNLQLSFDSEIMDIVAYMKGNVPLPDKLPHIVRGLKAANIIFDVNDKSVFSSSSRIWNIFMAKVMSLKSNSPDLWLELKPSFSSLSFK
jgi:hypothetical protein